MYLLALQAVQLFPDGTLFIHVGLILLMIWVLNRTLYRPINRVLALREKNKGGQSSEAAGILKDVSEKDARYVKEMLDTRSKGYELIEKEQKAAVEAREKQLGEVKAEIADKFSKGKADLEKNAAEAHDAISSAAEKMADRIAAGILRV